MNCPSCGAPMQPDGDIFRCAYCRSVYVPSQDEEGIRLLAEAAGQDCPVCHIALMHASIAHVPMLSCTRCRGMLLPMEVFPALVDALRTQQDSTAILPPADPAALGRVLACPRCHQPMEAHFYGGPGNVVLDSCESCLLNWLDHGELTRIAHAPDSFRDLDAGA